MDIFDILIIILYLFIFFPTAVNYYKNILKRSSFGKIIIKIKRVKYYFLIPVLVFPLFTTYAIYDIFTMIDYYKSIDAMEFFYEAFLYYKIVHIYVFVACMYYAIVYSRGRYITEKGICSPEGFFYWNEIKNFYWINDNCIQFNIETKEFFRTIPRKIKWYISEGQKSLVEKEISKNI